MWVGGLGSLPQFFEAGFLPASGDCAL